MKKFILVLLAMVVMSGCADYYASHKQFAISQSQAIQSSKNMIEETKTTYPDGTIVETKHIANPMAAWAATQMQPPIEPGASFWTTLRAAFPWAFGVWAAQAIQNISTSNKGNTTNVSGNNNVTGPNPAGQNMGNTTKTITSTNEVLK